MEQSKDIRRLAAIVFVDIVGFTSYMDKDEAESRRILASTRELVYGASKRHNGRVLKEMGDGMLLMFDSVIDAARASLDMQDGHREFLLRIGIHIGDVYIEQDDVFGSGVNIASRLQDLANPGGICVSVDVWNHVRNQQGLTGQSMGPMRLKGVTHPVEVYRMSATDSSLQPSESPPPQSYWGIRNILFSYVVLAGISTAASYLMMRFIGLPYWLPWAVGLTFAAGLPVMVLTARIQSARQATTSGWQRMFNWRNTVKSGVAALSVIVLLAGAHLLSWATGIGPVGSLQASGALADGDRIVLADFRGVSGDPALAAVVTEALRVDLLGASVIRPVDPVEVSAVLSRMQMDSDAELTLELAQEVAIREGIKAVLGGDVAMAGNGVVLTATLQHAETGRSLAAFRETASNMDGVIAAIDRLSRRIRERAGESLRSIHASQRLDQVTTSSLEALRLFSVAQVVFRQADYPGVISRLERALELDPDFAMAWRFLAVTYNNYPIDADRLALAATRAFELRYRLTEWERNQAEAFYYHTVVQDWSAAVDAYQRVLAIDPDDPSGLNNLSILYLSSGRAEQATDLLQRAVTGSGVTPSAFSNLVRAYILLGDHERAMETVTVFESLYPDNMDVPELRFWVLTTSLQLDAARAGMQAFLAQDDLPASATVRPYDRLARLELMQGRPAQFRAYSAQRTAAATSLPPSFRWFLANWEAVSEAYLGDAQRAASLILTGPEGGMQSLPAGGFGSYGGAYVLAMTGHIAEAEDWIRDWETRAGPRISGDDDRLWVDVSRAVIHLHRDEPELALSLLESARSVRGCDDCWADQVGLALHDLGRLEHAAAEWEKLVVPVDTELALFPLQYVWSLIRLAPLYEDLGDHDAAQETWSRLAALWADAEDELQAVVEHARQ